MHPPTPLAVLYFLVIWVWKSSTGWKPHIGGGKITNSALGAQIDQIECGFLQISPAITNSGLENKKLPPKNTFLVAKKVHFSGFSRISENGGYLLK